MDQGGIYFVSRMRKGVVILSKEEEKPIDLAKMLKKRGQLDISVFAGAEEKLPTRLIAIPVEQTVAAERRRKSKRNRDRRCNPSKESLYLLGWELFITNVSEEKIKIKDIAELYFIRWRIETIFKCWKSYFRIIDVPNDSNKIRLESYIYSMLIFIMIFQAHYYSNYSLMIQKKRNKKDEVQISMIKMMQYIVSNISQICLSIYCNRTLNKLLKNKYCIIQNTNPERIE